MAILAVEWMKVVPIGDPRHPSHQITIFTIKSTKTSHLDRRTSKFTKMIPTIILFPSIHIQNKVSLSSLALPLDPPFH
uniref:Ovule protein n=1 Tax=Panagrellus redivivus TaxID=6233 RepID=A0A7E4ZY48_PANRE